MDISCRLATLERRTQELTFLGKVLPGEAILDEPEKDRRRRSLPADLWKWCVEQLWCDWLQQFCLKKEHFHDDRGAFKLVESVEDYLRTVKTLILAYWWGPQVLSNEARGHLEQIHQHRDSDDLPDVVLSKSLKSYLATNLEARYEAFERLRTRDRRTFLRIVNWIAAHGGNSRIVRPPEAPDNFPFRILRSSI